MSDTFTSSLPTNFNFDNSSKDEDKHQENVDALINLKFSVERQVSILSETFNEVNTNNGLSPLNNIGKDLSVYALFTLNKNNIEMYGKKFLEEQTSLLKSIDALLLEKCNHNWINDTIDGPFSSKDICYCGHCYIRKN